VDLIKKGLESFNIKSEIRNPKSEFDIHILFSAHSLPQKFIDDGDPYVNQIMGTIQEITKIVPVKWHLSYQSKSGPVKWLEPSTDEKIKNLAAKGIKNVLVVPISFVSDHIETLYEIDILYKDLSEKLGITLKRIDSLNTHPVFIGALKDVVKKCVKEKGWNRSSGET
jgi:ferrochelatase